MTLPVEVLFGIYLGLLTGVLPALVAWSLGFVFKYFTDVTVPGLAVVVLGVAIAGVNGGLLGLYDEAVRRSPTLVTALLVVLMMTLYAHNRGDKMGDELPHRITLRSLHERTLSTDVIERVGRFGQVRVTVTGQVSDLEGYPPLPASLRVALSSGSWTFPADLSLGELEKRLADRLRTEFDLGEVSVTLDQRGQASIAAAPPAGGVSKRVPEGKRAVSVNALVPTGLARGDLVTLETPMRSVQGTVVSARSDVPEDGPLPPAPERGPTSESRSSDELADGWGSDGSPMTDGGESPEPPVLQAPTTAGGEGRITAAVSPQDAVELLSAERVRIVVRSRGSRREYELVSLLRHSGKRIRRTVVSADDPLAGMTLRKADVRETYGVAVLAIRRGETGEDDRHWRLVPRGSTRVNAGDELFVVGTRDALDRFEEATP